MTPEEIAKVFCPYCGAEMLPEENSDDIEDDWKWWYECPKCAARAPVAETPNAARDKALLNPNQLRDPTKSIYCKDCAHLEYEDLGIYYCGLHRICGQLSPDDYCSRGERKERKADAARD